MHNLPTAVLILAFFGLVVVVAVGVHLVRPEVRDRCDDALRAELGEGRHGDADGRSHGVKRRPR